MIGKGNDCLFPLYLPIPGYHERIRVRCGHCIYCKMAKAREWSLRLEMESQYWNDLCFVTLTYDDDNLPYHIVSKELILDDGQGRQDVDDDFYFPSLAYDDLTLFIKRVRKCLDHKIKYYAVGEYGTRRGRPHWHILFFGLPGTDECKRLMESKWNKGFVKVKPFFPETCIYVAGYVQKKLYGKDRIIYRLPEVMRCSQHLGEKWLFDHMSSIDDQHPWIVKGKFKYSIPRQFRKKLVELGRLKETSLLALSQYQMVQYMDLCEDLKLKDIGLSEFFDGRWRNALAKESRKNFKRDLTGDI